MEPEESVGPQHIQKKTKNEEKKAESFLMIISCIRVPDKI
jgi:hypothetical protein